MLGGTRRCAWYFARIWIQVTLGHSWAGRTPLDHQSAKRAGCAKSKKGNRYLAAVTGETAVAAGKTYTREGAR